MSLDSGLRICAVIPCYNEEITIGRVVSSFKARVLNITVYVCDNGSTDNTAQVAEAAGAIVLTEKRRGKANALRRLLSEADADIYVLCDGDMTYDIEATPVLIDTLKKERLDMVVGRRVSEKGHNTWRFGHGFGNWAFTKSLGLLFGGEMHDALSGFRVCSKRFVKSFPFLSKGFDIEVEFTVHALANSLAILEIPTRYFERPTGSFSKLRTFRDGWVLMKTILRLTLDYHPLRVFLIASLLQIGLSIFLFIPVWLEFLSSGEVSRFPTAILCLGLMITGLLSVTLGVILESIARQSVAIKRLAFLSIRSIHCDPK